MKRIVPTQRLTTDELGITYIAGGIRYMYLCDKLWTDGDVTRWLVVPTCWATIRRLERGVLSLRDALRQPLGWVVETSGTFAVDRTWTVDPLILPDEAFPPAGNGLLRTQRHIPQKTVAPVKPFCDRTAALNMAAEAAKGFEP